jgi:hypothetical protein
LKKQPVVVQLHHKAHVEVLKPSSAEEFEPVEKTEGPMAVTALLQALKAMVSLAAAIQEQNMVEEQQNERALEMAPLSMRRARECLHHG